MGEQVFPWLKTLPLAPEYHPTMAEFQDPISYIFKIEEEASRYGICKIVPPVPASCRKTIVANLNRNLSSQNSDSSATFTTRIQQIGFSPRKHKRPVQRSVWQSGVDYTLPQFELKAKNFEKKQLNKGSNLKKSFTPIEIETLYWKAQVDKPLFVEYANDMPGSAFDEPDAGDGGVKQGTKEVSDVMTVGETQWNMRRASRADGSLLKFLKEEIPGVTSPMIYLGMLYSWFAWHVEDHDLHSLNYMHMGAGKTWYGVPMEAAFAFEEVIRSEGYGGELSPIVTFATLGGKTTIISPEVLVKAGVPCCRLVQNPGEFVVTFPRAYHSGFSLGFNCAEATNFATPGWLQVAREAAIRRVSTDLAPMVSHSQLLYDLALSLYSSEKKSSRPEQQSSQLKKKLNFEGDALVKRIFMQDVMHNNELLDALGNGSPTTLLSEDVLKSLVAHGLNLNFDNVVDRRPIRRLYCSYGQPNKKADPASLFSCVTCGSPCYSCVAIVQPSETAAHYLMSNEDVNVMELEFSSGKLSKNSSTTGDQRDMPALDLLALAYGDSSDSDGDSKSKSTKFVMESNHSLGTFEYAIEVPSANRKPSLITNGPMGSAHEKDCSRMHVFCLEHAREVKQRLRSVGGVRMLLLCHQDYREINDAARLVSKELGLSDDMWTDVRYVDVTEQDKTMIRWALDDEETATGDQDWAVKLGIDIFCSAKLIGSAFYKKQMPSNSVIYNAFRQSSQSNDLMTPKQSGRQKKVVMAGKWCGKVWMSNQVHPLLAVRDEDKQHEEEHEQTVHVLRKTNVKHEKQSVVRKNMTKRKRTEKGKLLEVESSPPPPPLPPADSPQSSSFRRQRASKARNFVDMIAQESDTDSGDESDYSPTQSAKRKITARKLEAGIKSKPKKNQNAAKKAKKVHVDAASDEEGAFSCDLSGCDMSFRSEEDLKTHKQNNCLVPGCEKQFFSHTYLLQHRRVHTADRPLKCQWHGCKKTFKWVWARTEHMRVHTGERPYVCDEDGCGQTFRFVSDFSRHRRSTGHVKKMVKKE